MLVLYDIPSVPSLFDIQLPCCRLPLAPRKLSVRGRLAGTIRRIIAFDPQPAFERIAYTADPLKRIQVCSNLSLQQLFPPRRDGYCDCGCAMPLTGRQTRWATPACSEFVWYVYAIIAGRRDELRRCLEAYYGRKCACCGQASPRYAAANGRLRSGIEADHIIPVHQGGGACWLSNYLLLCVACHKLKTKQDRKGQRLFLGNPDQKHTCSH